ncbi:MAG: 3-deoxy-manno-octulosonate cytidylyltransferase [Planctomycetes bacterium]|nr:3-deoxy-manno-octulosonate cytidylyltransferase [Planctomycetota bacterium]
MKAVAVIPARYASTRFPGKPLAKDTGRFLIQHVVERVRQARRIERVIVATDDERIAQAVTSFGGDVQMTRFDHPSGTHRVREVTDALDLADDAVVLNVQGDEPEISPASLDRLVDRMFDSKNESQIATIAARFDDNGPREGSGSPLDPNCVKVVVDAAGRAMYFSRSPIPYPRDTNGAIDRPSHWLLHLGIYAYRVSALRRITSEHVEPGVLERAESLEQLRWMEHGFSIAVVVVDERSVGIDTPADYAAFVKRTREETHGVSV